MDNLEVLDREQDTVTHVSKGGSDTEKAYYEGGGTLASPSLLNTSSRYLNSPYFREVYASVGLRRNGPDVPATFIIPMVSRAMGETVDFAEYMRLIHVERAKNEEFAAWLDARRDTAFRKEDLKGSPSGTLAYMIWEFLDRTGYDIELSMKGVAATNDLDYIHKRRANTHDISHLVTGFGANFAGEAAINWCDVAASAKYFSPELAHYMTFGQSMIATGQMHQTCTHYPAAHVTVMQASVLGINAGLALDKPLMMQPWEDMLDMQVEDVTKKLGIVRGPGQEAWDWTDAATTG